MASTFANTPGDMNQALTGVEKHSKSVDDWEYTAPRAAQRRDH